MDGTSPSYKGRLQKQHRSINGCILGESSFSDANRLFGDAPIWHSGDAAASEHKACYVSESKKGKIVFILASNSEMSGGATVDELRLMLGNVDFSKQCKEISIKPEELKTESGIRLGTSFKDLKGILGEPSGVKNGLVF